MTRPHYLKEGDQIGFVSAANKISINVIKSAVNTMQSWGLEPVFGQHIFAQDNQFAGSDKQRSADIQDFMDNPQIKAIISTRGGYGSVRIIDKLNFEKFKRFPKWIIGYSDITVFLSHLNSQLKMECLHSTMPLDFPVNGSSNNATESLRKALFGELKSYVFKPTKVIRQNQAHGELIGGNLSILYSLIGSISEMDFDNKILFIEDVGEYLYHIDRMMINLKRMGKLKNLAALVVGGMTNMKDNKTPFGKTTEEIIAEHVEEYKYPVVFGFPAGHIKENYALRMGANINLLVDKEESKLVFD